MEYCKGNKYGSKDYCPKRMECAFYVLSLRNSIYKDDKFFDAPFEKDKCNKFTIAPKKI